MTDQPQLIVDYEAVKPGTWSVSGIGGTNLPVLGKGKVAVVADIEGQQHDLVIADVLHVDKLGINLFSIGAATENGMRGSFVGNKCLFYYNDRLVLTGERAARTMYYLNIRSKVHDYAHTARPTEQLAKWHQRLGHADSKNIWRMFTENLVDGMEVMKEKHQEVCSGCAKGICTACHSRHLYPRRQTISEAGFTPIFVAPCHTRLWEEHVFSLSLKMNSVVTSS